MTHLEHNTHEHNDSARSTPEAAGDSAAHRNDPPRRWRRGVAAAATATLVALPLAACSQDSGAVDTDEAVETTDQDATEPDAGLDPATLSFEEVAADLADRVGEEVMVTAEVEKIITPGVALIAPSEGSTLEPIALVGLADDVGGMDEVEAGSEVTVTGIVKKSLQPQKLEKTFDVQLDDELLGDYDGRPYINVIMVHSGIDVG